MKISEYTHVPKTFAKPGAEKCEENHFAHLVKEFV